MDPVCQSRRESETAAQEHTETQGKLYPFETHWIESYCWGPKRLSACFLHNPQPNQLSLPAATAWKERFVKIASKFEV